MHYIYPTEESHTEITPENIRVLKGGKFCFKMTSLEIEDKLKQKEKPGLVEYTKMKPLNSFMNMKKNQPRCIT